MNDVNRVTLIGRLTRDCELKYTATGTAVCKFSIAVNRSVKRGEQWEDEPSYFDIVLWGKQGEALDKYLIKGKQVGIDGELRQDRWQQDGQNRSKVEVIASNIQLLGGGKNESDQSSSAGTGSRGSGGNGNRSQGGKPAQNQSRYGSSDDDFKDDIPF
jgi:single-strand DNA-binding protein